jgi:hypothetical protein
MTAPTIADYLKYANLQMAAEAFLKNPKTGVESYSGPALADALKEGNNHASKFTETEAQKFSEHWEVVDQKANTSSGFSGTLFKCIKDDPATGAKIGELVISFRSTEFIDDAVNDCQVTNKTIKEFGWGFGQIADMEDWYAELRDTGKIPAGAKVDVTGYSLGGHLATAFRLMHGISLNGGQVITFNGAGVGEVDIDTTLSEVIKIFKSRNVVGGNSDLFTNAVTLEIYQNLVYRQTGLTWIAQ